MAMTAPTAMPQTVTAPQGPRRRALSRSGCVGGEGSFNIRTSCMVAALRVNGSPPKGVIGINTYCFQLTAGWRIVAPFTGITTNNIWGELT